MKNYVKPTFTLASLVPTAFVSGSCSVSEADQETLEWMFPGQDWTKMFVDTSIDGCEEATNIEGMYCKMAYSEGTDITKLFGSF